MLGLSPLGFNKLEYPFGMCAVLAIMGILLGIFLSTKHDETVKKHGITIIEVCKKIGNTKFEAGKIIKNTKDKDKYHYKYIENWQDFKKPVQKVTYNEVQNFLNSIRHLSQRRNRQN